jgi:hypothetical protein
MNAGLSDPRIDAGFATACLVTLCGGTLMFVAEVVPVPAVVPLAGLAFFVGGTLLIAGLAVILSRRTGKSVLSSVWLGIRIGFAWILCFMP